MPGLTTRQKRLGLASLCTALLGPLAAPWITIIGSNVAGEIGGMLGAFIGFVLLFTAVIGVFGVATFIELWFLREERRSFMKVISVVAFPCVLVIAAALASALFLVSWWISYA